MRARGASRWGPGAGPDLELRVWGVRWGTQRHLEKSKADGAEGGHWHPRLSQLRRFKVGVVQLLRRVATLEHLSKASGTVSTHRAAKPLEENHVDDLQCREFATR